MALHQPSPTESIMQALETLSDDQINSFLMGQVPLTLALRIGNHMMLVQLELSSVKRSSRSKHKSSRASSARSSGCSSSSSSNAAAIAAAAAAAASGCSSGTPCLLNPSTESATLMVAPPPSTSLAAAADADAVAASLGRRSASAAAHPAIHHQHSRSQPQHPASVMVPYYDAINDPAAAAAAAASFHDPAAAAAAAAAAASSLRLGLPLIPGLSPYLPLPYPPPPVVRAPASDPSVSASLSFAAADENVKTQGKRPSTAAPDVKVSPIAPEASSGLATLESKSLGENSESQMKKSSTSLSSSSTITPAVSEWDPKTTALVASSSEDNNAGTSAVETTPSDLASVSAESASGGSLQQPIAAQPHQRKPTSTSPTPEYSSIPIQAQRNPFFFKPELTSSSSSSAAATSSSSSVVNLNAPIPPHFQYFPLHPSLSSLPHIYHPAFGSLNPTPLSQPESTEAEATTIASTTTTTTTTTKSSSTTKKSSEEEPQLQTPHSEKASSTGTTNSSANKRAGDASSLQQTQEQQQQTASCFPTSLAPPLSHYSPYIFPHYLPFPYSPFAWSTVAPTPSTSSSPSVSSGNAPSESSSSTSSSLRRQQAAASAAAAAFPPAMLLPSQFFHSIDSNHIPNGSSASTPAMSMAALDAYAAAAAAAVASVSSAPSSSRSHQYLQQQQQQQHPQSQQHRSHHHAFKRTASVAFKQSGSGGNSSKRPHHHNHHHSHRDRLSLPQQQQQLHEQQQQPMETVSSSGMGSRQSQSLCPGQDSVTLQQPPVEAPVKDGEAPATMENDRIPPLAPSSQVAGQPRDIHPPPIPPRMSASEEQFLRQMLSQNRPQLHPSLDAAAASPVATTASGAATLSGNPAARGPAPLPPLPSALATGDLANNGNTASGSQGNMALSGTAAVTASSRYSYRTN